MKCYRQGDVLLVEVSAEESNMIKTGKNLRENNRVVLAHGEVTGHAHVVVKSPGKAKSTIQFFGDRDNPAASPILRVLGRSAELRHDEHGTIEIPVGTYRVVRQREYSPVAIKNVAD